MTDSRGVCAERAERLTPGVPYVRGWFAAKRGADDLARELNLLGLASDFPGLRPDVNVAGDGLVCVGVIRPDAAEILARLISAGLAQEMAERVAPADRTR